VVSFMAVVFFRGWGRPGADHGSNLLSAAVQLDWRFSALYRGFSGKSQCFAQCRSFRDHPGGLGVASSNLAAPTKKISHFLQRRLRRNWAWEAPRKQQLPLTIQMYFVKGRMMSHRCKNGR
jgi:hypothetical protein